MADRISQSIHMGHFSFTDGTSLDSLWSFKAVRMADGISLSVRMCPFSCTDGTSLDSPLSVELNSPIQYG